MTRPIDAAIRDFIAASSTLCETLGQAGASPPVLAAVRRDGEVLARVLRQLRADLTELRAAQHSAAERTQSVVAAYEHDLQGRLDELSERLAHVEQALLARMEVAGE
jgi:hypothetical protein